LGDKTSSKGFKMAIGWLTVLQSVPWSDVVSNAPKVASGAKKLWNAVAKKSAPTSNTAPEAQVALSPEAQAVSALKSRILELETAAADLQNQMIASSGLIKALAEQNTQLILRIESMRIRMVWLAGALAAVGLAATVSMVLVLMR
jgi:ribonuclease D